MDPCHEGVLFTGTKKLFWLRSLCWLVFLRPMHLIFLMIVHSVPLHCSKCDNLQDQSFRACLGELCSIKNSSSVPTPPWSSSTLEWTERVFGLLIISTF